MKKIIPVAIALFLLFVPFLFWGDFFLVGGDDSKLYYLFPEEYLKNFTYNFISNNQLGVIGTYFSQTYITPFAMLLSAVKKLNIVENIQFLFFGLNLSFGFLSFYTLTGLWDKNTTLHTNLVRAISSFMYVTSSFLLFSVMSHHLFSMYLVSILPATLYLFIRSVRTNKKTYSICAALLVSLFSIILFSIPYLSAFIIVLLPILLFEFLRNKKNFVIQAIIFLLCLFFLNFHWISHFVYAPFSSSAANTSQLSSTISADNRSINVEVIEAVTRSNQVLYPMLNAFHKQLQIDFNWASYTQYKSWFERILPLNSILVMLVLLGGIHAVSSKKLKRIYTYGLIGWLISLYLFTVNIGSFGQVLFIKLATYIPGFIMFRNMFDKFGPAIAFSTAFIVTISAIIVMQKYKSKASNNLIIFLLTVVVLLNSKPLIAGDYYNLPVGNSESFSRIQNFNNDYYDLLEELNTYDKNTRVLWLPLNTAGYVFIEDAQEDNNYYIGVSPMQFLIGKPDYTGLHSFSSYFPDGEILTFLKEEKYEELSEKLATFNISHIIVNQDIPTDIQKSYLFSFEKTSDVYSYQNDQFTNAILGEKIQDFGQRYSLYEINPDIGLSKIVQHTELENIFDGTRVKSSGNPFKIMIDTSSINSVNNKDSSYLTFLEPYHDAWELRNSKDEAIGEHKLALGYAQTWKLSSDDKPAYIYFKLHRLFVFSNWVSIISLFVLFGSVALSLLKAKHER